MFIVLNDHGGDRMDVTDNVTTTLRAESHHPPIVLSLLAIALYLWIQTAARGKGKRYGMGERGIPYPVCRNESRSVDRV